MDRSFRRRAARTGWKAQTVVAAGAAAGLLLAAADQSSASLSLTEFNLPTAGSSPAR